MNELRGKRRRGGEGEREGGDGRRDDSSGAIYHASPTRVLKAMKLKAELLFLPLLSVAMRKSSSLPRSLPLLGAFVLFPRHLIHVRVELAQDSTT